ncbi:MAG TPA: peptide ABC transporter substrate-binding protein, partial [Candidatus Hydrogenedentes bacterium]|nr:peptide ABC transporter substrate-binding protein [Candidatus Hydrogenedentota bacterium]
MRLLRSFIAYGVIVQLGLVTSVWLQGCAGQPSEPNVLLAGNGTEPAALVFGVSEHRILSALFEGLATMDPGSLEPEPAAASRWEISDGGLVYRFYLDPDARWSDGTPVKAEDFVYAWRRMLTPALGAEYAYMLHCLAGARDFNEGRAADFSAVGARALSDDVLEVRLEHPTPYFLRMQSHFAWYPVKREAIEASGRMDDRNNPWARPGTLVSNGPFRLAVWQPNDQIRVERNPFYRRADKVRLNAIVFYPVDNQQTEERLFRAGLLDMTSTIPRHKIPVYRQRMPDRLQSHPYLGTYFYRFNVTRPPLDDPRVRRALVMALDRRELVDHVLKGGETPADRLVPDGMADYQPPAGIPFDPESARRLLS